MSENPQLNKTYALLKEVYGPLENLSQTQWSQIERGVKALMKEHGPDIPLESLKAVKHIHDNYQTKKMKGVPTHVIKLKKNFISANF